MNIITGDMDIADKVWIFTNALISMLLLATFIFNGDVVSFAAFWPFYWIFYDALENGI